MDIFTLQTFFINAFSDDLTDKVFARSSPPVQGKRQRLFGVGIVQETPHGFYNHLAHQVLPEELLVQILLQSCKLIHYKITQEEFHQHLKVVTLANIRRRSLTQNPLLVVNRNNSRGFTFISIACSSS